MPNIAIVTPYVPPSMVDLFYYLESCTNHNIKAFIVKKKPVHRRHKDHTKDFRFQYSIMESKCFYLERNELAIDFVFNWKRELKEFEPDLIIFDGYGSAYFGAYIYASYYKVKKVFWNSNTSLYSGQTSSLLANTVKSFIVSNNDWWIAGGSSMKDYLLKYGAINSRISLAPRAVDTVRFQEDKAHYKSNVVRLIFVGELNNRKGCDILLDAYNKIDSSNIELYIVGDGKDSFLLHTFAQEKKVKNVFFLGELPYTETIDCLINSDILIVPSRREPFGRIVNEGLAAGLWVIVSDSVGAKDDLICHPDNGEIFSSEDVEDLSLKIKSAADKIIYISETRDKRIDWIKNNWSIKVTASRMSDAINSCLKL